jgi:hypothetical protein
MDYFIRRNMNVSHETALFNARGNQNPMTLSEEA